MADDTDTRVQMDICTPVSVYLCTAWRLHTLIEKCGRGWTLTRPMPLPRHCEVHSSPYHGPLPALQPITSHYQNVSCQCKKKQPQGDISIWTLASESVKTLYCAKKYGCCSETILSDWISLQNRRFDVFWFRSESVDSIFWINHCSNSTINPLGGFYSKSFIILHYW